MEIEQDLYQRSGEKCELCSAEKNLSVYAVPPDSESGVDDSILICDKCREQVETPDKMDTNHWRCLNDSMWSQVPVVQVMAWRLLTLLRKEGWPQDLLDMLYLDDETLSWAQATAAVQGSEEEEKHLDSNGTQLQAGDTVTLIKDLNVKGANFAAKRGTAVRGISLVADNTDHIEGKVNGQQIVLLTKFVKKSN